MPIPMVKTQNFPCTAERALPRMVTDCSSPAVGCPSVRKMMRETLLGLASRADR